MRKTQKKTMDVNAFSVFNLSKICRKNNIILVQISTHAVFDGTKTIPYQENDIPNPLNIYAYSKLVSEYFCETKFRKVFYFKNANNVWP